MRFPVLTGGTERRLSIPVASGGMNIAESADAIADNQLQRAINLWMKEGRLRSRPVVQPTEGVVLRHSHDDQSVEITVRRETIPTADGRGHHVCLTYRGGSLDEGQKALRWLILDEEGRFVGDSGLLPSVADDAAVLYIDAGGSAGGVCQLVMLDGTLYRLYADGYEEVQPYIPLRFVRAVGQAENVAARIGGYTFESRNLLTDAYRAEYVAQAQALYFPLPQTPKAGVLTLTCMDADGEAFTHTLTLTDGNYVHKGEAGTDALQLCCSPVTRNFWLVREDGTTVCPAEEGYAALTAEYRPTADKPSSDHVIGKMTFGTWFGGDSAGLSGGTRFFVSGNPELPHLVHYSALNDPTYFPEYSYAYIGASSDAVTAFGKQAGMLIVFKQRSIYGVHYTAATLSAEDAAEGGVVDSETQAARFSVTPLSESVGCDCPQTVALCGDRSVWANRDGHIYALAGHNPYSRYNVAEVGAPIAPLLRHLGAMVWETADAGCCDGHYVLRVSGELFLMHGSCLATLSALTTDRLYRQFVWYRWHLPIGLRAMLCDGERMQYLAVHEDADHMINCMAYTLQDGDSDTYYKGARLTTAPVESEWMSKAFDFGYPDRRKQVRLLSLTAQGENSALYLSFADEAGEGQSERRLLLPQEQMLTVSVGMRRVRRAAVRCRAEGSVAYGPISWLYTLFAK